MEQAGWRGYLLPRLHVLLGGRRPRAAVLVVALLPALGALPLLRNAHRFMGASSAGTAQQVAMAVSAFCYCVSVGALSGAAALLHDTALPAVLLSASAAGMTLAPLLVVSPKLTRKLDAWTPDPEHDRPHHLTKLQPQSHQVSSALEGHIALLGPSPLGLVGLLPWLVAAALALHRLPRWLAAREAAGSARVEALMGTPSVQTHDT